MLESAKKLRDTYELKVDAKAVVDMGLMIYCKPNGRVITGDLDISLPTLQLST